MNLDITTLLILWRMFRACCLFVALALLLAIMASCLAVGWGIGRVMAAPDEPGLDVVLILDQSQSLYDLGGIGSDPGMLRMEGARLFASYLGVDGSSSDYRLGVVYFGTEAELVVPLTAITGAESRQAVQEALATPEPMGWTDIVAALALAYEELFEGPRAMADRRSAVVIFTDGRPQTESLGSPAAEQAYMADLHNWIGRFTGRGTAVFAILLRNSATDADPYIQQVYRPFWVGLAESGVGIRFYDARASDDLMAIYHDIVVALHRGQTQGAVVNQVVQHSASLPIQVPSGWRRATFIVRKSDPILEVAIHRPDGRRLGPDDLDVGYTGVPGKGHEEIWSVLRPAGGTWLLQARGQGTVTVWLDYQPDPPTPTAVPSSTPTARPSPTATSTATPSATLGASPTPTGTATPTPTATPSPSPWPTGTATPSPTPTPVSGLGILQPEQGDRHRAVKPPGFPPMGLLIGGLVILFGGAGLLWRRRHNRPTLDGALRVIRAPEGRAAGGRWDLGRLRKPAIILGRDERCQVVLPDDPKVAGQAAQIRATRLDGQGLDMSLVDLVRDGSVLVNDQPVGPGHRLAHGDVIQIGGYRLRYENVLRRERVQIITH